MNILGIDYGTKNIGLAWCDTGLGMPLPFGVVKNINDITKIIKEEKIDKVVVGLPVGLDGKENLNTARVKKFVEELENSISAPVEFFDERFSSQAADRSGDGATRDEKSAMVILQDWLEAKKK
ncbi:MAG: Holliday junction resolvase RuvX [Patescibacteria group bacterium]|nr:Holliday junction resolvase RuvX [Patescibacteria group bacterium]